MNEESQHNVFPVCFERPQTVYGKPDWRGDIPALLQLRSHLRRRDKRIQLLDTDGSDWRDNRRYRSHHTDYFKHQKKQRPLVSHKLSDHRRIVK